MNKYREAEERGEYLSDEEEQQFLSRYREIIRILSEHDLSDIDFEEWRGMLLFTDDENPLDFSKTKANIDFSILEYDAYKAFPNFKSCQIKHFDFEKNNYTPEMFDEEFRKENEGRFLSENLPEEVSDRFYKGELTLTDIHNYPDLANKIEEKNLAYGLRDIYKIIGREEFCKLDAQFFDTTRYSWTELINSNPNLRTAEKIMPVLYRYAREQIIGYSNDYIGGRFGYGQDQLGERFREENPDLFLSEEVPENVRKHYYGHDLSMKEFSENLEHFEGKIVAQSFRDYGDEKKIISLYGEGIYQLFADYKPLMDKIIDDYTMSSIEVPSGPITEEQRKEIMSSAVFTYITRNGFENIQSWNEFKMILDFTPIEQLPLTPDTREFIEKYGIDTVVESGIDIKYLFKDEKITSLEEISNLKGIDIEDIKKLVDRDSRRVLDSYDVKQLLEYGIKDLSELSETTNDLHQIKEMLEKRPMDLINMGRYGDAKKRFIERYGIDNIIALDEETGGIFSHEMWSNDIYLTLMAHAEGNAPKLDADKKLTYEEFKNRMYEILLHARDERGPLQSGDYPDYDFIQGKFRDEHPEIFIDGDIDPEIKRKFYIGHMSAEDVRKNPELIEILQGKDLSKVFTKKMTAGISIQMMDKDGNAIGGVPNTVNMAQYLSERLGQEEFLKICADYGKCLDNIGISTKNEITIESVRETIEQAIYKRIKEKGIEYFEELPLSFQEKHPELFLPKEIDDDIRNRFYEGKLSFEDIRKNPQIKEILLTKDIGVGFGRTKYGQEMLARPGERYVNPMWEKLTEQEIIDLAEKYGKYLKDVNMVKLQF